MLSEELVRALKTKTKLADNQLACITESEGWEIIQELELINGESWLKPCSLQ